MVQIFFPVLFKSYINIKLAKLSNILDIYRVALLIMMYDIEL